MGKILSGENMRIFTTVLCFILFTSTISYGYEQVPDDAKVKTEDISTGLGKTLLLIYLVMVQKKLMLCLWINH